MPEELINTSFSLDYDVHFPGGVIAIFFLLFLSAREVL